MALRPLDPSIVNFYQPPKINMPDPLQDVAALEQIKSGRVSRQLHEQQLAQLQRDSASLDKMKEVLASKGQSTDLDAAAEAMIGTGTIVMPHVFIGPGVVIGKNCVIYPNVTLLSDTIIGDEVIIQAGTVIGSDAFYYNTKKNRPAWFKKMPSCGRVIIEDKVEIGANCTIDKGVSGDTIIGMGTKMDNMVHIGHDTQIEANCLFAAQVGVAGGVKIKAGVTIWGQAGVGKTLTIGENATLLARTGVVGDIEGNKVYMGFPAEEASIKRRELVWIKRIPQLWKKMME